MLGETPQDQTIKTNETKTMVGTIRDDCTTVIKETKTNKTCMQAESSQNKIYWQKDRFYKPTWGESRTKMVAVATLGVQVDTI